MELSLKPEDWALRYSRQFPRKGLEKRGNGWGFDLRDGRIVRYIMTKDFYTLKSDSVVVEGSISCPDDAEFFYKLEEQNTGDSPPKLRILLCKSMYGQYNRWWSIEGALLQNGAFSLNIPLIPSEWVSVYGKTGDNAVQKFKNFKQEEIQIGIVFGGGSFYGHGVKMTSGNASFKFSKIKI